MVVDLSAVQKYLPPRYRLQDVIGVGGMGTVYLVRDRLRGQQVALKHIHDVQAFDDLDTQHRTHLRASLTREFRTLASLRHPNIVSVLDYGFDGEGIPFFTMEWLRNSVTLLTASVDMDTHQRVELLTQLLRALFYVHRRGIVHRDLKPNNILVIPHAGSFQVKVLDFGLSIPSGQATDTSGTIYYLAPEIITQTEITPAADLYAVGVLLYQMFAGGFPFPAESMSRYVAHVLNDPPLLPSAGIPEPLEEIIHRLLAKNPRRRYGDARETIRLLNQAVGETFPVETLATRDSFIQAAQFVGREAELRKLEDELHRAREGQGQAWLIAGESGVGKSRLLDELRVAALTAGVEVVISRGQQDGEGLYKIWQGIMMPLLLSRELSDEELAILNILDVDVAVLLERPIPPVPDLEAAEMHQRIVDILTRLVTRHHQPLLIILEDVQWASEESLLLVKHITEHLAGSSVLLICTYRDDEAPHIPQHIPSAKRLHLERLDMDAVTQLVTSMMGSNEDRRDLVKALQTETGGNAFFLVEMVRALAEQAGELDAITHFDAVETPARIRQVLANRFQRLSEAAQRLLQAAALAGQEIDIRLLHILAADQNVEALLQEAAEYHVTEWRHGRWRFAHDKLREQALANLSTHQRAPLHRQIAEGLEVVYREDSLGGRLLLPAIALNWELAGEPSRALPHLLVMAQDAFRLAVLHEALEAVNRAIACGETAGEVSPEIARQIMDAYYLRFYAHRQREERDKLWSTYEEALQLAERTALPDLYLRAYQLGADAGALTYTPQRAQACARKMLEYAQPESGEAFLAWYRLSQGLRMERHFSEAIEVAHQPIALLEKRDRSLHWHGWTFDTTLYTYFALTSFFENANAAAWSFATSIAYCYMMQGDYASAEGHLRRALDEVGEVLKGSRYAISLHNLALHLQGHGDTQEALRLARELQNDAPRFFPALTHTADYLVAICRARVNQDYHEAADNLFALAKTNYAEQEIEDAIFCARDALALFQGLGDVEKQEEVLGLLRQMNDPLLGNPSL